MRALVPRISWTFLTTASASWMLASINSSDDPFIDKKKSKYFNVSRLHISLKLRKTQLKKHVIHYSFTPFSMRIQLKLAITVNYIILSISFREGVNIKFSLVHVKTNIFS